MLKVLYPVETWIFADKFASLKFLVSTVQLWYSISVLIPVSLPIRLNHTTVESTTFERFLGQVNGYVYIYLRERSNTTFYWSNATLCLWVPFLITNGLYPYIFKDVLLSTGLCFRKIGACIKKKVYISLFTNMSKTSCISSTSPITFSLYTSNTIGTTLLVILMLS